MRSIVELGRRSIVRHLVHVHLFRIREYFLEVFFLVIFWSCTVTQTVQQYFSTFRWYFVGLFKYWSLHNNEETNPEMEGYWPKRDGMTSRRVDRTWSNIVSQ